MRYPDILCPPGYRVERSGPGNTGGWQFFNPSGDQTYYALRHLDARHYAMGLRDGFQGGVQLGKSLGLD